MILHLAQGQDGGVGQQFLGRKKSMEVVVLGRKARRIVDGGGGLVGGIVGWEREGGKPFVGYQKKKKTHFTCFLVVEKSNRSGGHPVGLLIIPNQYGWQEQLSTKTWPLEIKKKSWPLNDHKNGRFFPFWMPASCI